MVRLRTITALAVTFLLSLALAAVSSGAANAATCTTSSPTGSCGPYTDPNVFTSSNGADLVVQNDFSSIPQTLTASGDSNWTVAASTVGQSDQTSVKSYPATQVTYTLANGNPDPSSDFGTTLVSNFTNVVPSGAGQDYEYAADDWLADPTKPSWSNDLEIMIWTHVNGQVPAGNDTGKVYTDAAGTQWEVWVAGGATTVSPDSTVSFVRKTNTDSGSFERIGFYKYLQSQGMLAATYGIDQLNYGLEICSTGGATRTYGISSYTTTPNGTVQAQAPAVTTNAASGVTSTAATLNGSVNPEGQAATYQFEYGTTTGYGTSVPVPAGSAGSGTAAVNESANLTGLAPGTTYHYRIGATNATGTAHGTDQQFTTASASGCTGVAVTPSSNIQSLINANPAGTTFCFAAGTYTNASQLAPLNNDVFDGDAKAAILDGGHTSQFAFYGDSASPGPSGVTIRNFTIQNYATPLQRGAIQDYNGSGWVISGSNITGNAAAAVATGDNVQVLSNTLDGNAEEGFSAHGTGGLYQSNDISNNNVNLANDGTFEAGGGKAFGTTNLTFRSNTVNHNGGPGLWADTNNIGTVFTGNTADNNWGPGIYEEISYNFTITGNDVEGNGTAAAPGGGQNLGYAWDAGIQVRLSQGLTGVTSLIGGNTVYDNYNGISLIQSPSTGCTGQGEGQYGPCTVQNVTVQNNGVTMTAGATGGYQDGAGDGIFSSQNNHFTGNNYCVSPATHGTDGTGFSAYLQWLDAGQTFASWQADGNDTSGTYTVTATKCQPGGAGGGSVSYDATGPSAGGAKSANSNTLTWAHTVGAAGTNRALLAEVSVGISSDTGCTLTVKDGATAMTRLALVHDNGQSAGYLTVWGLANPPTGANTITATTTGCSGGHPNELTGGSESFAGVSQSTPFATAVTATGSGTAPSVTAASVTGNLMAGFTANGSSIASATSPSTSRFIANGNNSTGAGNSAGATSAATGSNVTMKWTVANDWWAAAEVQLLAG